MGDVVADYESDYLAEQIDAAHAIVPLWSTAAEVRTIGLHVRRSIPDWARLYRAQDGALYWVDPWQTMMNSMREQVQQDALDKVFAAVLLAEDQAQKKGSDHE